MKSLNPRAPTIKLRPEGLGYALVTKELQVDSWWGQQCFLFPKACRLGVWPTQPPVHYTPGISLLEVKRPRNKANDSPPSAAEVMNVWSDSLLPHMPTQCCA